MAIKREAVRQCDRCGTEVRVTHHRHIYGPTRKTVTFDACEACAAETPLAVWLGGFRRGAGRRVPVDPAVVERAAKRKR